MRKASFGGFGRGGGYDGGGLPLGLKNTAAVLPVRPMLMW